MTGRRPVPLRSLAMRLPDAGRIRIGIKVPVPGKDRKGNPKSRPEKIDRFRFTSQDRTALDQVATVYGGQVTPWSDPKAAPGQHQVITDADELHIALPPDPLGNSPVYELWSAGGCARRCDGETCEMLTSGRDGLDLQQVPCICDAKQALECNLHTRLSVLLPDVRFGGVWRLDTKGQNAAHELPGMVDLIRSLQDRGIVRATLRVEWRKQAVAGETREFAVPVLGIDQSLDALAAGQARLTQLSAAEAVGELGTGKHEPVAERPALVAPPDPEPPPLSDDDVVVDAEIIDGDGEATITDAEAASFAATLNDAGQQARRDWLDTFGCAPASLPAARLDDAIAFVARLPAAPRAAQVPPNGLRNSTVAGLANEVFDTAIQAAPPRTKSRVTNRLRHAVVWAATDGRRRGLTDCEPADLPVVWAYLNAISTGAVTWTADAVDDAAGATFTPKDGPAVTVLWADLDAPAHAAATT